MLGTLKDTATVIFIEDISCLVDLILVDTAEEEKLIGLKGKLDAVVEGPGSLTSRFGRALQLFPTGKLVQAGVLREIGAAKDMLLAT